MGDGHGSPNKTNGVCRSLVNTKIHGRKGGEVALVPNKRQHVFSKVDWDGVREGAPSREVVVASVPARG